MRPTIKNVATRSSTVSGGYAQKMVLQALLFGFLIGCSMVNTVCLFQESHNDSSLYSTNLASLLDAPSKNQPSETSENNAVIPATTSLPVQIKEIDCKHHHAEGDPNAVLEEDPKRFVNKTDPNFWISLLKKEIDMLRWGSIMVRGNYYEAGITNQFQEILKDATPGVVIDVGMNIGWFTIYSRAMGHNVIAFDPNPIMHSRVCNSLKLNQWWDGTHNNSGSISGVTTFAYGLGDQVGGFNLTIASNFGSSTLLPGRLKSVRGRIQVPVTTLDLVATQMGWLQHQKNVIIHLLKIDTEGYEPFIIRGGSALINSGLVQNIFVENNPNSDGSPEQVLEWFTLLWNAGLEVNLISNGHGYNIGPQLARKINDSLRNGAFEGSESHGIVARKVYNMWWKKRIL